MDTWRWIDRSFEALRDAGALDRVVASWNRPVGVRDLDDVIRICRDSDNPATQRDKDEVLVGLCLSAAEARDDRAATLLCWLFLPGLTHLFYELRRRTKMDEDDLGAELLAGFWDAATKVNERSRFIARSLLTGARRRAVRAMRAASRSGTVDGVGETREQQSPVEEAVDDRVNSAVAVGVIDPVGAQLLFANRATIGEMAARYHLSLPAAQQVRHRARQRMAKWLKDS